MIAIVDYGLGNIFSVAAALQHLGAPAELTANADAISAARALILPGVGAFEQGMDGLRERGLVQPIRQHAAAGKPLLGICLGMQLLFSRSLEYGEHEGLGIIEGNVEPIQPKLGDPTLKVPHIGWSPMTPAPGAVWQGSLFDGLDDGCEGYFVHSFSVVPADSKDRLADAAYGALAISAAIQRGNIAGCQFHPERSGPAGLQILRNYLAVLT